MDDVKLLLDQARLVAQRLERVSADSLWARRSSGLRGALLRSIERLESPTSSGYPEASEFTRLEALIDTGYEMLEKAARERLR
jgi:hypothetical protein